MEKPLITGFILLILITGCINGGNKDKGRELLNKSVIAGRGDISSYEEDVLWEINMRDVIDTTIDIHVTTDRFSDNSYATYKQVINDRLNNKTETTEARFYITRGVSYIQEGGVWRKQSLPEKHQIRRVELSQTLRELMEETKDIELAGEEEVRGVSCFFLTGEVKQEDAMNFVENLFGGAMHGEVKYVCREASVKLWIAKDTYLMMKSLKYIKADVNDIPVEVRDYRAYYDFNKPVDIEIPDEI